MEEPVNSKEDQNEGPDKGTEPKIPAAEDGQVAQTSQQQGKRKFIKLACSDHVSRKDQFRRNYPFYGSCS